MAAGSGIPDFIVIGAMKAATSTVCAYLETHPEIFMAPGEPNYFSHDDIHARGPGWYASLFAGQGGARLRGEGSNDYANGARFPEAAARMALARPELKLIYMVRHPIERLASAWVQNRVDKGVKAPDSLERAVREHPEIYLDQSLYWRNLSLYRQHFPDAQIFVGLMEDLKSDPDRFFAALTGFLGVPALAADAARAHRNASQGKAVPTRAYSVVKRLPLLRALKRRLPAGLRQTVKTRYLSRPVEGLPALPPALHQEISELLRADSRCLLDHLARPPDTWAF